MTKITLLLFSRNDIKKAIKAVLDLYDFVDEIVLIDSSDEKQHRMLLSSKTKLKLTKIRIYYVVPFGYLEPAVMYALGKCTTEWGLLLGTDERVSSLLKKYMHDIINGNECAAISIRRFEDVGRKSRGTFVNWQSRLFRINKISFRGIIHEEPIVNGETLKLSDNQYFIDHVNELKGSSSKGYAVMEKFLRMNYKNFNERLVDYFYKVTVPKKQDSAGSFGKSLEMLLKLYEKLGGKDRDMEISHFDYFMFYYLRNFAILLKERKLSAPVQAYSIASSDLAKVREWQREEGGDDAFKISKIIYRIGLIKFLELDKESTIKKINNKFRRKMVGVTLLIYLLKLRYEKGEKWLD